MTSNRFDLPERLPPAEDVDLTDRETFYRRMPAAAFVEAAAARRRPAAWRPALAGVVGAGALAATLLLVVAPWNRPAQGPVEPGVAPVKYAEDIAFGAAGGHRAKSNLRPLPAPAAAPVDLSMVVRRAGRPMTVPVPVEDGTRLAPDTLVRFVYDNPDYDYLMLVSVTGDGEVAVFYPMEEGPSIPILRGRGVPLHGAVQLDDHLGPERFFALFSATPLAWEQVETAVAESRGGSAGGDGAAWLRNLRRLPLGCAQATLLIEKELLGEADDG